MREVKLPSGATLTVVPAPFAEAKKLFQAVMGEIRAVPVTSGGTDAGDALKNLFAQGFASPVVDAMLQPCLGRCLYNGQKITGETFEPETARQDYVPVCLEVASENVLPFGSALFAAFSQAFAGITSAYQKFMKPTTPSSSTSNSAGAATPVQ